ncbi:MAG: AI-2E family transporter [Synechococcales cyanobacterium RM1_1_8]|nr:AI-2E family transporter [Synechococcales cyanobacterium RM1_1_8]
MSEQRFSISISLPSLLVTGLLLLLTVLVWQVRGLLLIVMTSVIVAAAIAPIVDQFEQWRFPRWLATLVAYIGLISTLVGVGLLAGPTIVEQVESLIRQVPTFIEVVRRLLEAGAARLGETQSELISELFDPQAISRWALGSSRQLVLRSYGLTRNILGTVFSAVLVLFLSGYMVADNRTLLNGLVRLLPQPWEDRFAAQVRPVGSRMGGYIRGRLLVSIVLGVGITIGLSFLGLKDYAIGLGAIAAVTNLVPFIGPILGSVPALLVALSVGGWAPLWVLILFVVVQNLETYVLDPLLVGSSVGIHPLYQLLAVLSGAQLLGIIGALIIPPWFAGVAVLVENLYLRPKVLAERRQVVLATAAPAVAAAEAD